MKKRHLEPTDEIKKAFRYHYQRLADLGKFNAPTSTELARIGIDTARWNDGKGYLPLDMVHRWADLEAGKIQDFDEVGDDPEPLPPKDHKARGFERQIVEEITKTGPKYSKAKPRGKEDKPAFTARKWAGEHYNPETKTFELIDNCWWNPREQEWQPGIPRLTPFYWIWEFYHDPSKYHDPVPLGDIHEKVLEDMERDTRVRILIGRDHLKTTVFNKGYMTYYACERPDLARAGILNIAWDAGLAEETFLDVVENLSENERILSFYGYVIDDHMPKTQEKLYFTYQGVGAKFGMRCTSFKSGSITGAHPYIVLIDDPQDEPLSEKLMSKFKMILNKKLTPAVGKKGKIIVTGTVKGWDDKNDIYLFLEKNPAWRNLRYPAANAMPPIEDTIVEWREREEQDPASGRTYKVTYIHVEVKDREKYVTVYPERYQIEDLVRKRFEMAEAGKSDDDFWAEYFLIATNPAGKYFPKARVAEMPPPGFYNVQDLVDRCRSTAWRASVSMWIDPGGAKSHGIAVVVGAAHAGKYYFFDFRTIREGPATAAETIANMILEWRVNKWACESNFAQAQTYADVLDVFIKRNFSERGSLQFYTPVIKIQSTGEKYQRIQTHISNMLGLEGQEPTFYANKHSSGYTDFDNQLGHFGHGIPKSREHDFDLLDAVACMKAYVFGLSRRAVADVM